MMENRRPANGNEIRDGSLPQGDEGSRQAEKGQQELSPEMKQRMLEKQQYREQMAQRMPPPSHRHRSRSRAGLALFRMRRFFARSRRSFLVALVVALSGVLLMISILIIQNIALNQGIKNPPSSGTSQNPSGDDGRVSVKIMELEDPIDIVQPILKEFIDQDNLQGPQALLNAYKMNNQRTDGDIPVELTYLVSNLPSSQRIRSVRFILSEHEDYSEPRVLYATPSKEGKVSFSHLKTGTLYFYKVVVTLHDATTVETESFFRTASGAPRFLSIADADRTTLPNIRDLGGWMTVQTSTGTKKVIRQGMIYRGCELDGYNDPDCVISQEDGVADMLGVLGIRTELDLRGSNGIPGYSALGYTVRRFCIQASYLNAEDTKYVYYSNTSTKAEREIIISGIRQAFAALADESNYPIYIHDVYGCDETGMICFLLEAMLGVDETQLKKDFDMSAFSLHATSAYMYSGINTMLRSYASGASVQELATDFLTNTCGIPAGDLLRIQELLLEEISE